jgi:hypothetical protein
MLGDPHQEQFPVEVKLMHKELVGRGYVDVARLYGFGRKVPHVHGDNDVRTSVDYNRRNVPVLWVVHHLENPKVDSDQVGHGLDVSLAVYTSFAGLEQRRAPEARRTQETRSRHSSKTGTRTIIRLNGLGLME